MPPEEMATVRCWGSAGSGTMVWTAGPPAPEAQVVCSGWSQRARLKVKVSPPSSEVQRLVGSTPAQTRRPGPKASCQMRLTVLVWSASGWSVPAVSEKSRGR
jgi:hypothetical protein